MTQALTDWSNRHERRGWGLVNGCAFSPDGRILATAASQMTKRFPRSWRHLRKKMATGPLTPTLTPTWTNVSEHTAHARAGFKDAGERPRMRLNGSDPLPYALAKMHACSNLGELYHAIVSE